MQLLVFLLLLRPHRRPLLLLFHCISITKNNFIVKKREMLGIRWVDYVYRSSVTGTGFYYTASFLCFFPSLPVCLYLYTYLYMYLKFSIIKSFFKILESKCKISSAWTLEGLESWVNSQQWNQTVNRDWTRINSWHPFMCLLQYSEWDGTSSQRFRGRAGSGK